jgi:hypothetical protein
MPDYSSFLAGAVTYPLPVANGIGGVGASLLRDGDPNVFYVLEFFTAVLQRHIGPKFQAEAITAGATQIQNAVGDVIPFDPEPYLLSRHTRFPLLSASRKSMKFDDSLGKRLSISDIEITYCLPPVTATEAERLTPILKSVVDVIDNRTELGLDPLYTPTGSTLGANVWELAGVARAEVKNATFGSLEASDDVFFPCVVITLELAEQAATSLTELEPFTGANVHEDLAHPDGTETTILDVVAFNTYHPGPAITSLLPVTGTKAGGTAVTITGTGFIVGTTPTVIFGGQLATNVVVVSATSVTCVTPNHTAYDSALVDVEVFNTDGQSDTLVAGYTFTTP